MLKGSVVTAAAAFALALTATALGERTTPPRSFTFPFTLTSPCTGEVLNGLVTFSAVETLVTDANGGTHLQVNVTYSGPYTGDAGTTFTESGKGRVHVNLPSSGVVNNVGIFGSVITGSDGTTFLAKERFLFVMDANGVVRVERNNIETNAYRCKGG